MYVWHMNLLYIKLKEEIILQYFVYIYFKIFIEFEVNYERGPPNNLAGYSYMVSNFIDLNRKQ